MLDDLEKEYLYSEEDLIYFSDNFTRDLAEAKLGHKSSLSFLVHQLPKQSLIAKRKKFQAISIGGTNYKSGLIELKHDKLEIGETTSGETNAIKSDQMLFDLIEKLLDPEVTLLCLNFAYPLKPEFRKGRLDGVLLDATKEHQLKGLIGQTIGQSIEQYFLDKFQRIIRVTSANDTVCLVLAGVNIEESQNIVAGIVGTGLNFGFFDTHDSIINIESGNFNKFTQSETGKLIDDNSQDPGLYKLEKEIAGAYLYQHYNLIVNKLKIDKPEINNTKQLDLLIQQDDEVAKIVVERSASLTAVQIAGIFNYKNQQTLTFVMEGSLFWRCSEYKKAVEHYLNILKIPKGSVIFEEIENSSLIGAAGLALGI